MSVFLSPIGNGAQFFTASGLPNNGGLLYSYLAGSSTAVSTFTTSTGNVQNANPIVLGADGRPPQEIWITGGSSYKFILQDALGNALATYDNISGINDSAGLSFSEWLSAGLPTYISATSFSLLGNQTGIIPVNQRVKTINTGGVIYSSIVTSVFNAGTGITTFTVLNDSGVIDSGLSSVNYGFTNPAYPSIGIAENGVPAGMIMGFGGVSAPLGWLACPLVQTNISRATYTSLFSAIGTTWGAGDGSTTFGIPWFPADYAAIQSSANVGTQSVGSVGTHVHTISSVASFSTGGGTGINTGAGSSSAAGPFYTSTVGTAGNMSAGARVLICVKF